MKIDLPVARLNFRDSALLEIVRGRKIIDTIRIGPNKVHALIIHGPGRGRLGEIEDLGISENVLITASGHGRDMIAGSMGGVLPAGGQGSPLTAISATTATVTGTPYTTNQLAGMRIVIPVTGLTTRPVYGNIISNTTSVITVDGWWDISTEAIGTTPAATSAFVILPGYGSGRYMALTQDAAAAAATDTALASEITTGGCARALAAYAHTLGQSTYTLTKAFSVTSTFAAIHKMAIFMVGTGVAGPMLYESVLNADASVVNGDSLTITETVTIS
jgi:hypothetical protein